MAGVRRSGLRFRAVHLAVSELVVGAGLLGCVEIVLLVAGPVEPTWVVVLFPAVGGIYLAAGTIAWVRRPSNQIGALLVLGGMAWLAAALLNTGQPALFAFGQVVATVPLAVIVHMLLAFPSGRLRGRGSKLTLVAAYATSIVLQAPSYLFSAVEPPMDVLQLAARPDLARTGEWVQRAVGAGVMLAVGVLLARRLRAASLAQRYVLAPLYGYGMAAVLFVPLRPPILEAWVSPITATVAQLAVLALVPVAFVVCILRGGFARTAEVEELGAWLGADTAGRPRLRDALADALGDPSVRLAFSSTGGGFIDVDGRLLDLARNGDVRAMVEIDLGGRPVGAIEYDTTLIDDAELVRAAGQIVALALDREQLTANLRASDAALRRSRARILAAGDDARSRIAHDLHDGLQTKLLLLALEASRTGAVELRQSIDGAIDELRRLVHGVMPPALIERGLYAAAEDMVDRIPIPARLEVQPTAVRPPPDIERAAYFVLAEALNNAVKHAGASELAVRLDHTDGNLRIDVRDDGVGGAAPTGAGLRGIADRVDVLGGNLTIDSPPGGGTRVMVVMPCAS